MRRVLLFCSRLAFLASMITTLVCFNPLASGQDASTGAIRGTINDPAGARVARANVVAVNVATGFRYAITSDSEGAFALELLPPGDYSLRIEAPGMSPHLRERMHVDVGGAIELDVKLLLAGAKETVTVAGDTPLVETQSSELASVIDERAIGELPINGRRFTDLVLLTPGVTQDPRSLTSSSNGNLSFGGIRGYSSYLVDGSDIPSRGFTISLAGSVVDALAGSIKEASANADQARYERLELWPSACRAGRGVRLSATATPIDTHTTIITSASPTM